MRFLERMGFDDILVRERAFHFGLALHRHAPGLRLERRGVRRRIFLVGAKLIVVVVVRNLFEGVCRILGAEGAWPHAGKLAIPGRDFGAKSRPRCQHRRRREAGRRKNLPSIEVRFPGGDFRGSDVGGFSDQHDVSTFNVAGYVARVLAADDSADAGKED